LKRVLIKLAQLGVSLAIIAFVVNSAQKNDPEAFQRMLNQPKNWGLIALSSLCCLVAVITTFIRWYFLVRALDLPFRLRDAFRLGFLGYFCNFISLGSVGGDLVKALFIAREQKGRRAEAVATVLMDRVVGLYALLVVASISILIAGMQNSAIPEIRIISQWTLACTAIGAAGILALVFPGVTNGRFSEFLANIPKLGYTLDRLMKAVRMYRLKFPVVAAAGLMSILVHCTLVAALFLLATGLPGAAPELLQHFVIVPLSMVTSALPLPAAGLGAFEFAMDKLYVMLPPAGAAVAVGQGLLVALTYRMITVGIALIGAGYYLNTRREMQAVIKQEEDDTDLDANVDFMAREPVAAPVG